MRKTGVENTRLWRARNPEKAKADTRKAVERFRLKRASTKDLIIKKSRLQSRILSIEAEINRRKAFEKQTATDEQLNKEKQS